MVKKAVNKQIPSHIQQLIWSKPSGVDLETDKIAIIHHVLRFGTLEDIAWLMRTYKHQQIKDIFIAKPLNIYSKPSYNLIKNTILKINQPIADEARYIQTLY